MRWCCRYSGDLAMPGLLRDAFARPGWTAELKETARAYGLPPATWDAYLQGLSANARRNIIRSEKALAAWAEGSMRLESVTSVGELDRGREVLLKLHHARWASDHQPGVFRSPLFLRFHEQIKACAQLAGKLRYLVLLLALCTTNQCGGPVWHGVGRKGLCLPDRATDGHPEPSSAWSGAVGARDTPGQAREDGRGIRRPASG